MSLNVIVPSVPRGLRITHTMWEDFLCDPVLAAWIIFRYALDEFQKARLRYYWWVPNVIDSSGFSSGKTIVDWIFVNLRCILLPDHRAAVYYPTHGTGKETFWEYFGQCPGKIYRSQIGETNQEGVDIGDGMTESGSIWAADYRNGNKVILPAPSFAKKAASQNSMRFNTIVGEEWVHYEASGAIDSVLIGRNTRESWNQYHPVWCNHFLLTAPAKTSLHLAHRRIKKYLAKIRSGSPVYAHLAYSYKDFSDLPSHSGKSFKDQFRIQATIDNLKAPGAGYLGEGLGIWGVNGAGWFTEEALLQAQARGRSRGVRPVTSRAQFESEWLGTWTDEKTRL